MIYTLTAPSPVRWGLFFCSFHGFLCSSPPSAVFRLPDPRCPAAFSRLPVRCLSPLYPSDFTLFCMALPLPPMTVQKIHCGGRNQPFCVSAGTEDFPTFFKRCTGRTRQCTKPDTCFARSRVNEKDQLFSRSFFVHARRMDYCRITSGPLR